MEIGLSRSSQTNTRLPSDLCQLLKIQENPNRRGSAQLGPGMARRVLLPRRRLLPRQALASAVPPAAGEAPVAGAVLKAGVMREGHGSPPDFVVQS